MIVDELKKYAHFSIYGAQVVAYGAYTAISCLCGRTPDCFVVSCPDGNPDEIEGIPVRTLEYVPNDTLVIVGVTELLQREILSLLKEKGYRNVFVLTQHEEYLLMSAYFAEIDRYPILPNAEERQPVDLGLYEVRNHRDTPLAEPPALQSFEKPIQAGADISEDRVARLLDNTGDNISRKNKQYCEMSATYWVWKNTDHDWKGIEHYRRHLLVRPEILHGEVDAVLPLPYICYPNTMAQFGRFVSENVQQALLKALRELHSDKYEDYLKILYGKYQYTYNLVCARSEVFDAYCEWFFNITEYMETLANEVPEIASTRALSYVAEVLTNLYFMYNQDGWRIMHVEKAIYI